MSKQMLIELFERNKRVIFSLRNNYKDFLDKTNQWNNASNVILHVSHKQCFEEISRICETEYSEKQYSALQSNKLDENYLDQYITALDQQLKHTEYLHQHITSALQSL